MRRSTFPVIHSLDCRRRRSSSSPSFTIVIIISNSRQPALGEEHQTDALRYVCCEYGLRQSAVVARFTGEWDALVADRLLAAPASQDRHGELGDMQRALLHLPQPQREALILVGAGGFAYEEAAEICQVAVGTIKSRVARGRVALETILNDGTLPSRREHEQDVNKTALDTIMGEVDELSRGR